MRLHSLCFAFALACSVLALPACSGSTTVEHVWRSPEYRGSFDHLVVFGMSKRPGVRRTFESGVAAAMGEAGVRATPSFELFSGEGEHSQEEIAKVLTEQGIDGVLVARLVAIDKKQQYVQGSPYAVGGHPRRGFYGYYHSTYAVVYAPGYTIEYDIVTVESNLYEVASAQLVWSGLSETFDPKNVEEGVASYAQAMTKTLVDAALVRAAGPS